jgi:hypothetical protein
MARVRITKLPKALSGLEMKMSAGLYGKGTNGNPQFRKSSYLEAGKISQQPTEVRDTLQPVAREGANLEAEKGETAMVNIDGIPAHFKIGGKRHSEGGTPLNLPDNSFIFSDTAKMKIKDPIMLAQFGMVPKKAGYTPAEIAKKYDINKFRQVLADDNTTDLERKTAEMMIANYNMKLAKLALLQESSKGFPQGIPVVAMPYVMATGMNPEEFAQMDTQGEEEQPDADMGVSRYGGNIVSQFDTKKYGGLPRAQDGYVNPNKDKETAEKFAKSDDPRLAEFYDAFQAAVNNPNIKPDELNALATQMENYDAVGWGWVPGSFQDRLEDLASRLRDRAKPEFRSKPAGSLESNYRIREKKTLSKANEIYDYLFLKKMELKKTKPNSSEYFKVADELDKIAPKTSGLVEKYPYIKPSTTKAKEFYKQTPIKLYSEEDISNINTKYEDVIKRKESDKLNLLVEKPKGNKPKEEIKKEEVATTTPAVETKPDKTAEKKVEKTSSKSEKDFRNMSDEELEALLKEE